MAVSESTRRRVWLWLAIAGLSAAGGAIFGIFQADYHWVGVPRGAVTGLLIGGGIGAFEIAANSGAAARLRRTRVSALFALRTAAYVAIITAGEMLARLPFAGTGVVEAPAFDQQFVNTLMFSLGGAVVVNLLFVMVLMLGPGTVLNLVSGRYHRPREEERIFMFVDLAGSTAIAERLGNRRFHALLDRFFTDMARPVIEAGGTIYRYVGDEMIVTWRMADPVRNARPLAAYAQMRAAMARERPAYEAEFGVVPDFRVALHAGPVVTGEMGSWKREITFLGDVVNTTARIEQACRETGRPALASADLVKRLTPPAGAPILEPIGAVALRGKRAEVALYAIVTGA